MEQPITQQKLIDLLAIAARSVYEMALASGNDELVRAVTSIEAGDMVLNMAAVATGEPAESAVGIWRSQMHGWNDYERAEAVQLLDGRWDVWPSAVLVKLPQRPLPVVMP